MCGRIESSTAVAGGAQRQAALDLARTGMNILIEFEVDSVKLNLDERTAMVDGKLRSGPIRLGDSINAIYALSWANLDGDQLRSSKIVNLQNTSLTILKIFSFRRYLEELSQGYTATIQVSGDIDDLKKIQVDMCIGFIEGARDL